MIASTLLGVVTKEMHDGKFLRRNKLQAKSLVPTAWAHVDTYLTTNAEREFVLGVGPKLALQLCKHTPPHSCFFISPVKSSALILRHVWLATNRTHVDGALSFLEKHASVCDGRVWTRYLEQPLCFWPLCFKYSVQLCVEALPPILAKVLHNAFAMDHLLPSECVHTILTEDEVESVTQAWPSKLPLLLLEVACANDAHCIILTKSGQQVDHIWLRWLSWYRQGSVHIKKN
jgi:hypothetical protein